MRKQDTIAAIATAQGEGGIAIVRISGPGALPALGAVFTRKNGPSAWQPNRLVYGHIVEENRVVDEAMAVYMAAPHSYTREDVCEIHVHGGRFAAEKTLQMVLRQGVRTAEPGEFTLRAFLNGRIDLSQAEAVMAMIASSGEGAARAAARQMEGALGRFVEDVSGSLTGMLALIEAGVDFPEEVDEFATREALLEGVGRMLPYLREAVDERAARIVREGLTVAIAGAPNAGKSSLMNALLKTDRSIVTSVPGTTRDVLSEKLRVGGLDITLLDTAGLRETSDEIEREGVERAKRAIDSADVVLMVVDASAPEGEAERELFGRADGRTLVALNKCDLGVTGARPGIRVSAKTGEGVDALLEELKKRAGAPDASEERLTQPRHIDCAKRAMEALERALSGLSEEMPLDLISVDLMEALSALGEITGRSASDDVIDAVFKNFCVGK